MSETRRALLKQAGERLAASGIDTAALDARLLFQAASGLRHEDIVAEPDLGVPRDVLTRFSEFIDRRCRCEPVSRILGTREFYGRSFRVTPDVLDPRADTETLIEAALGLAQGREALRILDSESLITVARGARGGARANLPDIDVTARYGTMYLQAHGTTFSDLHKARTIVEPPIAGALALSHDVGGIAKLRALIQAQEAAEDFNALTEAMVGFHESLVEMHGNKTLTLIARIVHDLVNDTRDQR